MGLGGISHWIIILVIVLLLFGVGRISGIMGELGKGVKSFKEGIGDDDEEKQRRYNEERRLQSRPPERPIEVTPEPRQTPEQPPLREDEPRH
jgi:sec-independent protein translocase protein TatA